jgi:hypothetical protein
MKSIEEQYDNMVHSLAKLDEQTHIEPDTFSLTDSDFISLIREIEKDGLIKGKWLRGTVYYMFLGLTFQGKSFVQNQDKKQYSKIEKTEINHYNTVNIGRDNNGQIAIGNNNSFSSEFDKKFTELLQAISLSQLADKNIIIEGLKNVQSDKVALQSALGHLLTRGAEVASLISMITGLLPLLAG